MILPRDSIIISLGGGFLAATMSFFVCFAVEAMLAGKITLAGVSDATFGFLLYPAPDRWDALWSLALVLSQMNLLRTSAWRDQSSWMLALSVSSVLFGVAAAVHLVSMGVNWLA